MKNMKNRSRNNSLDKSSKTYSKERANSMEFYIHSGSEKSNRSYSIGSLDTIYLDEICDQNEEEDKYPILTLRDSHGVPKVNKSKQPNHVSNNHNRLEIIEQGTHKHRKRDAYYVCDIGESPKPSSFYEYMKQLVKHK